MCGLLFELSLRDHGDTPANLVEAIKCRGPDSFSTFHSNIQVSGGHLNVTFSASVLGLRGPDVVPQPVVSERGVLGWNGQIFDGLNIDKDENDTMRLSEMLDGVQDPTDILAEAEGPYAMIYYDTVESIIYFQVDPLSRRSLLLALSDDMLTLSSVAGPRDSRQGGFRVLNGGEGGKIRLKAVRINDGEMDLSLALSFHHLGQNRQAFWTRVQPLNTALPSIETPSASIDEEVDAFITHLTKSIRRRVEDIPFHQNIDAARVAVLFSGGVDCSLLACLLHRCLKPREVIDLINVAFQSETNKVKNHAETNVDYDVPDRLSGLEAVNELRAVCPGREFRFEKVDVTQEEYQEHRAKVIDLMYPASTEMDLSLALPLYFASRGIGTVQNTDEEPTPYHVQAKVYLSGLGADEQLAGYSRHKAAFQRGGYPALIKELQLDLDRLPSRNLSRDDRMLSSHARDARYPYLDLSFVAYLSNLPVWLKCDLSRPGGDKLLLRRAARACGLVNTSQRVKRAMQFGTRSAKIDGKRRGARVGEQEILS